MNPLHRHSGLRDEDFIRMIRDGGADADTAIQNLYLLYRKSVRSSFIKLIHRFPEYRGFPDDLLHDSFLILLRKIESDPAVIQSLVSFWRGIGRGLLLNQLRKDERFIFIREPEEIYGQQDTSPEIEYLEKESQDLLAYSFSQLGPKCREILLLWIDKYTMTEIAQRLHMSNAAMVRKMKYECFKKLKEIVQSGNKTPGSRHIRYE